MRLFGLLLAFVLMLPTSGCSGGEAVVAESAEVAYIAGVAAYEAGRYDRAAEHFRAALDFGRTTGEADDAQLYLARSLYGTGDYLLAVTEFTRFAELYPNDPRVEEVEFERIRAYHRLSPPYELDQTDTEAALAYIRSFTARYPTSTHTPEVVAMQDELREKLARKQFETGRLYERRELYEAAALSFEDVLERFPTSPLADDALLGALRVRVRFAEESVRGRQADRFAAALTTYDRLVQLFPTSDLLRDAELLYDRAYTGRQAALAAPAAPPTPADPDTALPLPVSDGGV